MQVTLALRPLAFLGKGIQGMRAVNKFRSQQPLFQLPTELPVMMQSPKPSEQLSAHPTADPSHTLPLCLDVYDGAWVPQPKVHVPLAVEQSVPPLDVEVIEGDILTAEGYSFARYVDGYPPQRLFQPAELLSWAWEPSGCAWAASELPPAAVVELLSGRWIHLQGDSVLRDTYYDIAQASSAHVARVKVQHDMAVSTPDAHVSFS